MKKTVIIDFWKDNKDVRVATRTYVTLILTAIGAHFGDVEIAGSFAYWIIPLVNFSVKYINVNYLGDLGTE